MYYYARDHDLTGLAAQIDTSKVDVMADLLGKKADSLGDTTSLTKEEKEQPFSTYLEPVPQSNGPMYTVETELVPNMRAILDKPEVKKLIPSDVEIAFGTRSQIVSGRKITYVYVLKSRVQMSGEYLVDAYPVTDQFGKPTVSFQLTRDGGRIFSNEKQYCMSCHRYDISLVCRNKEKIHLKVDTGMGGLGVMPDQAVALARAAVEASREAGTLYMESLEEDLFPLSEEQLDARRYQMMRLFLIASYFGLPQISLPLPTSEAPVALSFVGRRGSDRQLIALAQRFCGRMKK